MHIGFSPKQPTKFFSVVLLIGFLLISTGCRQTAQKETMLRNVILTEASALPEEEAAEYPAVVEEGASVTSSFMADGKIGKIMVKEGDRVAKGQLLASLDDSDYRIGVAQLEAQFNQMTREKERMDAMYEKHNIAPNDYEKFQTGYQQMSLQLEMARRKLGYTRLYAPAGGYIASKYMNEGELVGAGTPVFNIIDDSHLIASVDLPVGAYLAKESITGADGSVPGISGIIPLEIISFTPDADNNMLYRMKLSIPSSFGKDITPGMNISVKLHTNTGTTAAILIPSRALFDYKGKTHVWIYNERDSTIHRRTVEIEGQPIGKMSRIKGLSNGDKVVETGVKQLFDGEKVNVTNNKELGL